uniref:(northern house mosquito) hypothetical protein n=1 Tax=Culex pipiens TaxID=7175 RepID=A0A8D8G2J4_CULPI
MLRAVADSNPSDLRPTTDAKPPNPVRPTHPQPTSAHNRLPAASPTTTRLDVPAAFLPNSNLVSAASPTGGSCPAAASSATTLRAVSGALSGELSLPAANIATPAGTSTDDGTRDDGSGEWSFYRSASLPERAAARAVSVIIAG